MLARVHSFAGRHADAVRELRALERRDYYDLAIEIYLADAYLARKQWVDAEREFRRVAAEVVKQIAAAPEGVNAIVPCPLDEVMVLGSVAAFACLGIAATLVDREVDLDQARKEVTLAREFVGQVENQSLQESWRASCDFWEGIVLLKQDRVEEAIKHLEATLRGKGDAGSYHQLANALTRKAELGDEAGRVTLLRRSVRYHREAQNLDWSDDLAASLVSGLARAESLAPAGVKLE
jgi:tetratricopeptide (TPR) repeat protein